MEPGADYTTCSGGTEPNNGRYLRSIAMYSTNSIPCVCASTLERLRLPWDAQEYWAIYAFSFHPVLWLAIPSSCFDNMITRTHTQSKRTFLGFSLDNFFFIAVKRILYKWRFDVSAYYRDEGRVIDEVDQIDVYDIVDVSNSLIKVLI